MQKSLGLSVEIEKFKGWSNQKKMSEKREDESARI
jgi:hypothetical protein